MVEQLKVIRNPVFLILKLFWVSSKNYFFLLYKINWLIDVFYDLCVCTKNIYIQV